MTKQSNDSEDPKEVRKRLEEVIKESLGATGFTIPIKSAKFTSSHEEDSSALQGQKESFDFHFDYKPRDVKKYLDRFVIGQQQAKRVLSIAICDHYNYVATLQQGGGIKHYLKQNILILGPTGVGKTYLIRCLADLIGVPFVKADATKFSETGYVGQDVDDLVRQLVQQADGNVAKAECGIIYLDEVDKLASVGSFSGRDVSGRGVQTNLLKLMEETEVPLRAANDMQGQMEAAFEAMQGKKSKTKTINTRSILFIASGSFPKLREIIERRVRAGAMGFQPGGTIERENGDDFDQLTTKDLIEYGFEAEFAGRLPVRVACLPLKAADLESILEQSEGSILTQYKSAFDAYNIKLSFTQDAIKHVALKASEEETGARALLSVLEKLLRGLKYELPSTRLSEVKIDKRFIEDPNEILEELLRKARLIEGEQYESLLEEFSKQFQKKYQLQLKFTSEAAHELVKEAHSSTERTFLEFCEDKFKDFPYGLKLIARHRGTNQFLIDLEAARNPDKTLSAWVVESYKESEAKEEKGTP